MNHQDFYRGLAFDAHRYLGAHVTDGGTAFRTYAPQAASVSLLVENREIPMKRVYDGNFFKAEAEICAGTPYEYRIYHRQGGYADHCDPYGFQMEKRPAHRSIVWRPGRYAFRDGEWMKRRTNRQGEPLSIYELHLGSWRRNPDGSWYTYSQMAKELIPYLKEAGYNCVEFMPLSEHPCDESWGYQNTGFFAPTSRYGTPEELMALIDALHQNGIGAILDFVPVHFAVDSYALAGYDGTALYEYPHRDVGVSEWGSCNFMHSRGEVRSFLQSSADYWLEAFHFDGLRMDAISRILYWQGDERRGVNQNGVAFLQTMNEGLRKRHRGVMLIAEDSSHYPGVTAPAADKGLGFDYKWDMGWMHDTLEYFQTPASMRVKAYHKLTFSMMYFRNERYLLPFSHDEVVHGKATILQKMNGDYESKFPQARAMYLFMMVHPGKKLNFMGNEFGQLREWDEKRQQDWEMRKYPAHDSFYRFMKELNRIYLQNSALYELDYDERGFEWIDCHQETKCVYAIQRKSQTQKLAAVFNFSSHKQTYMLSMEEETEMLLHTDWEKYGGHTPEDEPLSQPLALPPFSGVLIRLS